MSVGATYFTSSDTNGVCRVVSFKKTKRAYGGYSRGKKAYLGDIKSWYPPPPIFFGAQATSTKKCMIQPTGYK